MWCYCYLKNIVRETMMKQREKRLWHIGLLGIAWRDSGAACQIVWRALFFFGKSTKITSIIQAQVAVPCRLIQKCFWWCLKRLDDHWRIYLFLKIMLEQVSAPVLITFADVLKKDQESKRTFLSLSHVVFHRSNPFSWMWKKQWTSFWEKWTK